MAQENPADSPQALVPVEERTVEFYGDEIKGVAVMATPLKRDVFVPIRQLCDFLGVDYTAQRRRINRDPVLSEETRLVVITTAGGPQEVPCLPLKYLNGWLFGINATRVKEEIRDRLIRYQRECYEVLATAFQQPSSSTSTLMQVRELGRAIMQMAEEQMEFEHRLTTTEGQVDNISQRLVALEDRVAPGQPVTEDQASRISQAVKAVALELGRRSGRNEYGGVYGELYRKFGITSYKNLPAERFSEALNWLTEWHEALTGDQPF